ncbi:phosphotransferase [Thalassotalea mangrovi]|nr:phosphotransferase [Thalassotalea mangrovi]
MANGRISQLLNLPCFAGQDCQAEPFIGSGNHDCYLVKVATGSQCWFAKHLGITNGADNSAANKAVYPQLESLSPVPFYQDENWLILPFIDGTNILDWDILVSDKIKLAVPLMAKLHERVNAELPELSLQAQFAELLDTVDIPASKTESLRRQIDKFLPKTHAEQPHVVCHGDLNFANIIIDREEKAWLLDLEYLCRAPREYDIAMFMAINALSPDKWRSTVIDHYQTAANVDVNQHLIDIYLPCCLLLNGLWYASRGRQHPEFRQKASWQLQQFRLVTGHSLSAELIR